MTSYKKLKLYGWSEMKIGIRVELTEHMGLAHLCEHLLARILFTKYGLYIINASLNIYMANDSNISFTIMYNEQKLKPSKILRIVRKAVRKFKVDMDTIENEKKIIEDEIETAIYYNHDLLVANVQRYICGYNTFSLYNLDNINQQDINTFFKNKKYKIRCKIKPIRRREVDNYWSKVSEYDKFNGSAGNYNIKWDLSNMIDKETHVSSHPRKKIIILSIYDKLAMEHNNLVWFLKNIQIELRRKYDAVVYQNIMDDLNTFMIVTDDLEYDGELFKNKALKLGEKHLSKDQQQELQSFLNTNTVIYC